MPEAAPRPRAPAAPPHLSGLPRREQAASVLRVRAGRGSVRRFWGAGLQPAGLSCGQWRVGSEGREGRASRGRGGGSGELGGFLVGGEPSSRRRRSRPDGGTVQGNSLLRREGARAFCRGGHAQLYTRCTAVAPEHVQKRLETTDSSPFTQRIVSALSAAAGGPPKRALAAHRRPKRLSRPRCVPAAGQTAWDRRRSQQRPHCLQQARLGAAAAAAACPCALPPLPARLQSCCVGLAVRHGLGAHECTHPCSPRPSRCSPCAGRLHHRPTDRCRSTARAAAALCPLHFTWTTAASSRPG